MEFEFIDNNSTRDNDVRKRIRSHVALGRNAGKTLVRTSRRKAFAAPTRAQWTAPIPRAPGTVGIGATAPELERQIEEGEEEATFLEIQKGAWMQPIGVTLSALEFPSPLKTRTKALVLKVCSFIGGPRHPAEMYKALDSRAETSRWVQLMFMDEAYFHGAMAVSITALNTLCAHQEDARMAVRHISRALSLVNDRLSGTNALSIENIATVMVMAQYERCEGRCDHGVVHFDGLQRMIELRGGISELSKAKPKMALKIFRSDLEYSMYLGSPTRFTVEDVELSGNPMSWLDGRRFFTEMDSESHTSPLVSLLSEHMSEELRNLLLDAAHLSHMLNDAAAGHRSRIDSHAFHEAIIILGYRLNQICPLNEARSLSCANITIYVGLMSFLRTLLTGLDMTMPKAPLLLGLADEMALRESDGGNKHREAQQALLWGLFMGAVASVFSAADNDAWLARVLTSTLQGLGLSTWDSVADTLVEFPWVQILHDKAGQDLYHELNSRC